MFGKLVQALGVRVKGFGVGNGDVEGGKSGEVGVERVHQRVGGAGAAREIAVDVALQALAGDEEVGVVV
jgi:hypothetical protein